MKKHQTELKRHLSLFSLCVFGIGIIVGAGIYSVIGVAYGHAEESLWLSFLISGLAAVLTGISYCELATMYPLAGAEYIYLRRAFPRNYFLSFIVGMLLLMGGAATASSVAVAFEGYVQFFVATPKMMAAAALLVICTTINLIGIHSSNRANIVFTFVELIGIMIVIYFGVHVDHPVSVPSFHISHGTMIAVSLIFFVYLGFEDIANLSEEVRDPEKNIPRAILICLLITALLYLLVSLAVIRLIDSKTLAQSAFPLAEVLKRTSVVASDLLSGIALFSTANTVLVTMLVGSRMLYSIARSGDLPAFLGRTKGKQHTPVAAVLVGFALSSIFLFFKNLELLVSVSSLATLMAFFAVNFCVIRLRAIEPLSARPFRVPLAVGNVPLPSLAGLLLTFIMICNFTREVYVIIAVIILICGMIYLLKNKFNQA